MAPPSPTTVPAEEISPGFRLALTVAVMIASLMQVIDMTIANVALPHMQAALGATQDSISWVLTSYIVASAIAIPATGWLEQRLGRRKLFIVAVSGFTLASMLCGIAPSLGIMVLSRMLQGVFGAFVSPLSQATMLDAYPREKQAQATSIWAMGVMVGPIMGPLIGGFLTDRFDWRWVFFVNVPFGVVAAIGLWALLPEKRAPRRAFDLLGFGLLAVALSAFQLLLDRGTQLDWFDSVEIWIEAAVMVGAAWMFAVHSMTSPNPLIPVRILRDRNLMIASMFLAVASGISVSGSALISPMLQRLMGYGVLEAGELAAPRGVVMMASMLVVGRLLPLVDGRLLIALGLAITAASQWMMTGFDLSMGQWPVILAGSLQGVGFGLVMLPMSLLAFATLPGAARTEGAAIYSLFRSLGGAVAISITTALMARNLQINHAEMSAHVTAVTLPFLDAGIIEQIGVRGADVARMLDSEINRQALMVAYLDDYLVMALAAAALIPLTILLRRSRPGAKPVHIAE